MPRKAAAFQNRSGNIPNFWPRSDSGAIAPLPHSGLVRSLPILAVRHLWATGYMA